MRVSLDSAVVRVRAADGRVVGAGFLVGERQVLTCAHVVAGALGLPEDASELQKPGFSEKTRFLLDFPLIAPEQGLTARVVCWQPAHPDGSGDVAGLELVDSPPAGASPVRLVKAEEPYHAHRPNRHPKHRRVLQPPLLRCPAGAPRMEEIHDEIKLMQKALEVPRLPLVPHRVFLYPG